MGGEKIVGAAFARLFASVDPGSLQKQAIEKIEEALTVVIGELDRHQQERAKITLGKIEGWIAGVGSEDLTVRELVRKIGDMKVSDAIALWKRLQ